MRFGGVEIVIVPAGTVVGQDADGNDMQVTDEKAVTNGPRMWVTKNQYDLIKRRSVAASATPNPTPGLHQTERSATD